MALKSAIHLRRARSHKRLTQSIGIASVTKNLTEPSRMLLSRPVYRVRATEWGLLSAIMTTTVLKTCSLPDMAVIIFITTMATGLSQMSPKKPEWLEEAGPQAPPG